MRWAQTKKMLDEDGIKDKRDRENLFNVYETEEQLEYDLEHPEKFEIWIEYPKDDPVHKEFELDRKAQRKYELFVGGFLYYHDIEFKRYPEGAGYVHPEKPLPNVAPTWKKYPTNDFEHVIYFEWFPKDQKANKKTSVKIHITPTPPEYNAVPPRPPAPPPPEST